MRGVRLVYVDPRNTSRTCPECGCIDKHNRPSQSRFKCVACGCSGLADHIAALNIARRASVNKPNVSTVQTIAYSVGDKLPDKSGSS
ncbi:MAG: zinc ribbon domain-containing protein [Aggregatilineales bacterium]